jgi:hypothetical protein
MRAEDVTARHGCSPRFTSCRRRIHR